MKAFRFSVPMRTAAALLCVILVCAGLYVLENRGGVVWDLNPDQLTRLSEGTEQTLAALEETVGMHLVFRAETDSETRRILETLAASYARSGRVAMDTIDPIAEPGRIRAYAESGKSIAEGSVIIASEDDSRSVVIGASELYAYQMKADGSYTVTGLAAERKITGAIRTVTGGERKQLWFLTGHGEAGMSSCVQLVNRLKEENYGVGETSLLQDDTLQSGDVLLILSPARDLTQEESKALESFLRKGGRLLLACDASLDMASLPNVAEIARRVFLSFEDGIVVEDERRTAYWMNSPLYLMPAVNRESEAIKAMQEGQRVILPGARAVAGPEIPLSGYTYEALLSTSDLAYLCPLSSASTAWDSSMPRGAQQLAVSVSRGEDEAESRMVLIGSLYTLVDNSLLNSTYNLDLTISLMDYLAQREAQQNVPVRMLNDDSMPALTAQESWRVVAAVLTLPVLCVLLGTVVLIRRRKK